MDENLKKIIPFAKKYKSNAIWNVIHNILYALFGTIGMVMIFPVLKVLFGNEEKVTQLPTYQGISTIDKYLNDTLFYYVNYFSENHGPNYALLLTVSLVVITFLFKNLFGYLGLQNLTKLKTGVLRDLREKMFRKIIELPVPYYSEKRKGDMMARMLGDINEVQNSFFMVLELIVKEPLTIFFLLNRDDQYKLETNTFCFYFYSDIRIDYFKNWEIA
jgi:subfamily B ATP-binding cassette protein MsbA